jgi:DNA-binding MarR family transcriptional regulator
MKQTRRKSQSAAKPAEAADFVLSRRVMILSNLLKRAATIRYRRLLNLRLGEWGIVAQLGERAPRNLIDLAGGMGLDKAQISRSVSSLVRQGFVTRKPNPRNSREILIALTPRGRAAYQTIVKAGAVVNDALLADLGSKERRQLQTLLDLFTTRARALLGVEQALGPSGDDEDIANR